MLTNVVELLKELDPRLGGPHEINERAVSILMRSKKNTMTDV